MDKKKELCKIAAQILNVANECGKTEWIPCSERLPEYGKEVLTYNRDDEYEINHIIDEDDGEWFFNGVVAWMPLPDPYNSADMKGNYK